MSDQSNTHTHTRTQGPTVSNVYTMNSGTGKAEHHVYAATICVTKKRIYGAVKALQKVCVFKGTKSG